MKKDPMHPYGMIHLLARDHQMVISDLSQATEAMRAELILRYTLLVVGTIFFYDCACTLDREVIRAYCPKIAVIHRLF